MAYEIFSILRLILYTVTDMQRFMSSNLCV